MQVINDYHADSFRLDDLPGYQYAMLSVRGHVGSGGRIASGYRAQCQLKEAKAQAHLALLEKPESAMSQSAVEMEGEKERNWGVLGLVKLGNRRVAAANGEGGDDEGDALDGNGGGGEDEDSGSWETDTDASSDDDSSDEESDEGPPV